MSHLFDSLQLRSVTLRNRIGLSPMCMYSCHEHDGVPNEWHLAHLGARAAGGCGLVMAEATAVEPRGRISLGDTGIWNDEQVKAWKPITRFIEDQGAVPCIQLAHAGRKAGTRKPWEDRGPYSDGEYKDGVFTLDDLYPVAPSPVPFNENYRTPLEIPAGRMEEHAGLWVAAAHRAREAGFKAIELHMAHGYLLHSFLSPLTNLRNDPFGGDLSGRMSLPLIVADAVRQAWPDELPLLVRLSCTDWAEGGWDIEQSIVFCRHLKDFGVDIVDCSSGGAVAQGTASPVAHSVEPGYQVQFAEQIRQDSGIATAAVGMINEAQHAEAVISGGKADMVMIGRALLADPYWPQRAAIELGAESLWPKQYDWAV